MTKAKNQPKRYPWRCPKCWDRPVCRCGSTFKTNSDALNHGEVADLPCLKAVCYNCGWTGRLPHIPKKRKPKAFKRWAVKQVSCGCWWITFDGNDIGEERLAALLNRRRVVMR